MIVNELRIAGAFEIADAAVGDEVEVALRVRIYSIERDTIDVAGFGWPDGSTLPGGLRVQAVAVPAVFGEVAADYADSAE